VNKTSTLLVLTLALVAASSRAEEVKMPSGMAHPAPSLSDGERISGKVAETMNAASYTYIRVQTNGKDVWAAAPQFPVAVGDSVSFAQGMEMHDFHSDSLKRTFDSIYFVNSVQVQGAAGAPDMAGAGGAAAAGGENPHARLLSESAGVEVSGIAPAEGGKTVAQIYDEKAVLAGQDIALRAKVVKANPSVMGRNWYHVRDGTSAAGGRNDLTVTSADAAQVGDTVLVHGKVVTDKDFGFGYRYDVLVEDAKLTRE